MIRSIIVAALLTLFISTINGQSGSFVSVPVDARSVALGNTYITSSHSNGIYTNMAAYALEDNKLDVGYTYRPWLNDLYDGYSLNSFTAAYSSGFKHYFSVGYKKFTMPSFPVTDANGNIDGEYSPFESSIGIGYAYKINEVTAFSVTLNYLNSDLYESYSVNAYYADLGFKSKYKQLNYGVMIRNIGSKLSFSQGESNLPLTFAAGVGYERNLSENHSLAGQLDAAYLSGNENEKGQTLGLGVEYSFKTLINLRAGYHNSNEDVGLSFYSVGCGARLGGFHLDFAYLLGDNALNNNYCFSISWKM
ncbi:PorV/PorQ family protein [Carboxylicivirga caseinilyticus]|uniref:PorV/PorQ family protein n=1 Tax=Carboxylicivirga caseinilyticus TaxID=3417572 RepID=UPI003D336DCC|nr:PorV/PorQ family protein [Marinilabiliaceae bacterium A049]